MSAEGECGCMKQNLYTTLLPLYKPILDKIGL